MFLRYNRCREDGKEHRYWSVPDPGSEWRLHRSWFDRSAMADLLEDDFRPFDQNNAESTIRSLWSCRTAKVGPESLRGFFGR